MTPPAARLVRWLPTVGLAGWVGGAVLLWVAARQRQWSPGELVLAAGVWAAVLAVVAREPVRNLFGPVFWYELVRVGRRFSTFLFRFLYAAGVSALLAFMYLTWWERATRGSYLLPPSKVAEFATLFFDVFAVIQYAAVTLLTPAYVAGAITDEKERKTIDYLFTTDLANREIVFGKLAARVATVVLLVLAGLPLIAFLQLFGGIDPDLLLASTAAALVTAVGLSAVAIAFSAAAKRSRDAILAVYGVVLLYHVLSFALAVLCAAFSRGGWTTLTLFGREFDLAVAADWLASGNAVYLVVFHLDRGTLYQPDVLLDLLGRYAAFWGIAAVLALAWAVARLRAVALRQSYGEAKTKRAAARLARSRPEMGNRPLVWREVFAADRRAGCFGWLFRFFIGGLMLVIPLFAAYETFIASRGWRGNRTFAEEWKDFAEGMNIWVRMCTGVLAFLVFFGTALRGASAVAGEKDRDTWVSLCGTPVTVGEFLFAKWLGAVLSMRFALWALVGVWAIGLALGSVYLFMIPVTLVYLFVFTSAFALAGIWCSISARTALVANVRAFFLSVLMAGGFWAVLLTCCVLPMAISGSGGGREVANLFVLPLGATPPVVTGIMPMGSFDKYGAGGPGPFHPEIAAIGPCAPVFGLVLWGAINLVLYTAVKTRLTIEMNRDPVRPERRA